jgi:DNA invertase Pin-like site-specific DNA recombinase
MQLRELRAYAQRRGWHVTMEVEETGSSMKRRPKREALLRAARAREVDVIAVWKLDRFGRSTGELIVLIDELHELGVGFASVTEGFDVTTAAGRALAGMLGVFAQFEYELRRERVLAGIAQARRDGRHIGRPRSASLKAPQVRKLAAAKVSQSEIARRLRIARASVQRILAAA